MDESSWPVGRLPPRDGSSSLDGVTMAFDEDLADRVRAALSQRRIYFMEKRMMGGLCFMVADKMCLGIADDRLMVRLDPDVYQESLQRQGCKPMDFTGRPMTGFVFVASEALESDANLQRWVDRGLLFAASLPTKSPTVKTTRPTRRMQRASSTRKKRPAQRG